LIVGSGQAEGKGLFLPLYKSTDLAHWEYLHPLYQGEAKEGPFCECPSFFALGGKHVLVYSNAYRVGRYENHRLISEHAGRLDYGCVLVPQFARDDRGRWLLWGWINESRHSELLRAAGWAGVQTLPRVVSLGPDGLLRYEVAEELAALRGGHRRFTEMPLTPNVARRLEGVAGGQLEIAATIDVGAAAQVGLVLPDRDGLSMEILYDRKEKGLLARTRSGPLELAPGEPLELRVFIDGSVVEVIANRRLCLTQRIYPARSDEIKPSLLARGGAALARSVDVWTMKSIWCRTGF
jgi:beta-fructofuranosidase